MKRIITLAAMIGALVLPAAAFASSSSTCQSYNQQLCSVVSNTTTANNNTGAPNSGTTNTTSTAASTLPFTGLDVGLLVAGGGLLMGAGLLVRRFSRETE